jgi:hypothetical protein
VFYDRTKEVIWSPDGLGADDRAGIFAIMQIIKRGLRPHIIFTTDEEIGATGAIALACDDCPFKDLRFIIQLDRRGEDDCVFYDCDNKQFIDFIEEYGFVEAIGTFSDISMICPDWGVAGVNLSVGYRDEHSVSEVLFVKHWKATVDKVEKILRTEDLPRFEYVARKSAGCGIWYSSYLKSKASKCTCAKCGFCGNASELIPVKTADLKWHYYCAECIGDSKVSWCHSCGEAYELPSEGHNLGLCEDCFYDFYYSKY